ncbi:MAG: orotate phosphoribosyltransferase [Myxococcales bacterium]|nr:orotate phosphoribosyltransferase [Myxococcales bacterium]
MAGPPTALSALCHDRERLLELLRKKAFERRKVVLSSGKESDFYIDCRRVALTAEGHYLVGRLLFAAIRGSCPRAVAVGGLTLGADPLASAVSLTSHLAAAPLSAFVVRKEPKAHGTGEWIEGASLLSRGAEVAVLEDVVTTGASTLQAIERAQASGFIVAGVFALVDREEGGREAIEAKGYRVSSLFSRRDFLP